MGEFSHSWKFSRFRERLWEYLDERYPVPSVAAPDLSKSGRAVLRLSIAETMCEKNFLAISNSKDVEALELKLRECADLYDKLISPGSPVAKALRKEADNLQHEVAFRVKNTEQHEGANWVARFVAEECAAHYFSVTGKKPKFANSGDGSGPSSVYGKLVRDALIHLGKSAGGWQRACKLVCKNFDPDTLKVPGWD